MSAADLAPYAAFWAVVALAAYVVAHHIHHVLRGGHR